MRCKGRARNGGFTLLELMLAGIVLAVGVFSAVGAMSQALGTDQSVEGMVVASALAQEQMEVLKDTGWGSVAAVARVNIGAPFALYDRQITVSGDPKQVKVIIYWKFKGVDQQVSLETLLANRTL